MKVEKLNGKTIDRVVQHNKHGNQYIEMFFTDGTSCIVDKNAVYLNGTGVLATLY